MKQFSDSSLRSLIIFFWALLALSACSGNSGQPLPELSSAGEGEEYTASAGDTLMVRVWGEPRVSGEVVVRSDGKFTLPLIDDVQAEGKSVEQISSIVQDRLSEFITAPSVSVSVAQTAPIRYYLLGSFNRPGEYRSDSRISLLQAIAKGGGFAPFANEGSITLIRKTAGKEKRYVLDYDKVRSGGQPNPNLRNGDVISVE